MSKTIKLPRNSKPLEEQYPNEGTITEIRAEDVHENNYFKGRDIEEMRKKYVKFSILMEAVNETIELPNSATVEQFANRIRDLIYAQKE